MEIIFSPKAKNDLLFWKQSGNKNIQKKISALIQDIIEHPYEGIGQPEALKYELTGLWSRRINKEHRLIYEVLENNQLLIIEILSLRGHY